MAFGNAAIGPSVACLTLPQARAPRRCIEIPAGHIEDKLPMVPAPGFELGTYRLQGGCSTN
jgi:hypothetical protein